MASKTKFHLLDEEYKVTDGPYLTSGDIIWVPNSGIQDCIAYILLENPSKEHRFGLINMIGHKAGRTYLHLPNECKADTDFVLSRNWLKENWDEWIALGQYEDAITLRHYTLVN